MGYLETAHSLSEMLRGLNDTIGLWSRPAGTSSEAVIVQRPDGSVHATIITQKPDQSLTQEEIEGTLTPRRTTVATDGLVRQVIFEPKGRKDIPVIIVEETRL